MTKNFIKTLLVAAMLTAGITGVAYAKGKTIAWDKLPAKVQSAIKTEAGEQKVSDVEKDTVNHKVVYEAKFTDADGKAHTVTVGEDGKLAAAPQEQHTKPPEAK
jgi:hypothetical protein